MTPLQELLIQARSAAAHVAEPAYRRAAAIDAMAYREALNEQATEGLNRFVSGLLDMMAALPLLDSPDAIRKAGEAVRALTEAINAELPSLPARPLRRHWMEGDRP